MNKLFSMAAIFLLISQNLVFAQQTQNPEDKTIPFAQQPDAAWVFQCGFSTGEKCFSQNYSDGTRYVLMKMIPINSKAGQPPVTFGIDIKCKDKTLRDSGTNDSFQKPKPKSIDELAIKKACSLS